MCIQRTSKKCWYKKRSVCWKKIRVWRVQRGSMTWTRTDSCAAVKKRRLDWKASKCGKEDLWKEIGRKKEYSILDERTSISVKACQMEENTEKHSLFHCQERYEVIREIPEDFRKVDPKRKNLKEGVEVTERGIVISPLWKPMESVSLQYEKVWVWEAQELGHVSRRFQVHVTSDSSLLGIAGNWGAREAAEVQLDYDVEKKPSHRVCDSMETECEIQRTIKKTERTTFLCLLKKACGPSRTICTTRAQLMGKSERECVKSRVGDACLWIKIWEQLHELKKI